MSNELEIKKLSKEFMDESGYKTNLFKNITFNIAKNSFTSVLAPSGSGKTSFLKILAGLNTQTTGEINKHDNSKIIFIPSNPSSFPWMSVDDNIQFGHNDKIDTKKFVNLVGLDGYEDHIPNNKSLGFRFRISLARALSQKPSLIVLDEPFIQMDIETKSEIYNLLRNINTEKKQTFLLGTTNITESIYLSDKIILMKKNPAEILEEIEVKLGSNRKLELLDKEEFQKLRTQIEKLYKQHETQKLFNLSI